HVMDATPADVTGSPQAGSDTGTPYTLDPAAYTVSETGGPTGYTTTFTGDCDSTGAVTVAAGDTLTCTITNAAAPASTGASNVTIAKTWSGPDAGPDAVFTDTGSGVSGFTLTSAGTPGADEHAFAALAAGSYTFTETPISGWTLSSINCTGQTLVSNITTNLSTGTLSIDLGAGEDVTCEFVNTEDTAAPLLFNLSPLGLTAPASPAAPTSPTTGDTTANPGSSAAPSTSTNLPSTSTLPSDNLSTAPISSVDSSTPQDVSPAAPSTGDSHSSAAAPTDSSAVLGAFSGAESGAAAPAAATPSAPSTGSGSVVSSGAQLGIGALGLLAMALGFAVFAFSRRRI
ncbi:MAG: prealbumin-like fold domain-containing protein, partial [Tepidiformaceae bacterium]